MTQFAPQIQVVIDQVDGLRTQVNDHWQIPGDEALLLAMLVRVGHCVSICEIGTSYGFSTLHLAAAARDNGGVVHSFDISPKKVAAAGQHLQAAGLAGHVQLHLGDARTLVAQFQPQRPYDFAFIDATKEQSLDYLAALWPHLAAQAVLVTDNTRTHAAELADFLSHLRSRPNVASCPVMVGNGFELTYKMA